MPRTVRVPRFAALVPPSPAHARRPRREHTLEVDLTRQSDRKNRPLMIFDAALGNFGATADPIAMAETARAADDVSGLRRVDHPARAPGHIGHRAAHAQRWTSCQVVD